MAESQEEALLIIVIASWLNVVLFTLEVVLCVRYFGRPSRSLVHKTGVGVLIFVDTVCSMATCLNVVFAVLPPKNIRLFFAPVSVQIITTYISSIISQLFLCNLFFILTGKKIVAGTIVILILVHLAFSWASAIILLKSPLQGASNLTATTVGAVSCAATDIVIATCLAWKFWTMMAGTRQYHSTRSLLRRILILSVCSGAICAGNTLLMMILLLKTSDVFAFFFACQGRVYALTLLGNFLVGIPGRTEEETRPSLRLGTSIMNTTTVIFRDRSDENAAEAAVSPMNARKSADPVRPTDDRDESLPLEDLPLGRIHDKSDANSVVR
ncbi:hypothetical protein B0H12DRAFT_1324419 [Mycena haematopus]|nr:hypothetical protein B0H12DRAFT_1324419 [Mycena haematopus]